MNGLTCQTEKTFSEELEVDSGPLRLIANDEDSSSICGIEIDSGHIWPLLPDAEYEARFIKQEIVSMKMFKGAYSLFAHFEILHFDNTPSTKIYGAWPISISSSAGKKRISAGGRSSLYIMLCRVYDYRVRPDWVSLQGLRGCVIKVKTRTVKKNFRQRALPQCLWYSVVDDIISVEAGSV